MMIRSALFGIVLGSTLLAQAQPPRTAVTALRSARLFDGLHDATVPNGVVVIDGSRIVAAGSNLPIPAGATVIDLGDSATQATRIAHPARTPAILKLLGRRLELR